MKNIIRLDEVSKRDIGAVGGKGFHLGELKKAGFNVPEGFVITSRVYAEILSKTGLAESIYKILKELDPEKTGELEKASQRIQTMLVSTNLPEDAKNDIMEAYRKIGGAVAIRSSATAEDQKEASFAGQMDTFLNVHEKFLIQSIKKCMASLFTARAIYYRAQKNIGHASVRMAVVVQKMVNAKKAGVAFSSNPVNNNNEEIVIEAAEGSGEAVVGGRIIPDNYVIDKNTGEVKERRITRSHSVLNDEVREITLAVKKVEDYYGSPQDIEWALDNKGTLFILQARPITTLNAEYKPVWKKIISREYGVQYTELSIKCLSPLNKHIVPSPFYEQAYVPEDGNEACYIAETAWGKFVSVVREKYFEHPNNYDGFEKKFMETGSAYVENAKKIASTDIGGKSKLELKGMYLEYAKKNSTYGPFIWMQFLINNFYAEKVKEIVAGKLGKENKDLYDYVEIALSPVKKAVSIQLSEIAERWSRLSASEKEAAYQTFKWIPCLDIHNPPWAKEKFFLHMAEFKKTAKKPVITYESLLQKLALTAEEKQLMDITKRLSYLKDLKEDFRRQGILYGQTLFGEIARRMGVRLQDTSYLTEEEIIVFLENGNTVTKSVVEERKKGFAIFFNENKRIECKSGKDVESVLNKLGIIISEEFSDEITGTPASPGRAKGTVMIVRGVADLDKVKRGDILVAVTTHPDYVPAMQRAVAIVTDEGGITSHAAIVARELALPCIVGAVNATKMLKNGDTAEIDAFTGTVRKIKK